MTPPLLLTLVLASVIKAQTLAQDCATASTIWQKMGGTPAIPSKCCGFFSISCSSTRITAIRWCSKSLKNSIPPEIGNLTGLTRLDLCVNQLSGPIPSTIGSLTNLQYLDLSVNQLSGPIPSTIGSLTNLQYLLLVRNQLSGSIPSTIGSLTKLGYVYLHNNQLSGPIPSTIGSLTKLYRLTLNDNQLSGPIPLAFNSLTNLLTLWIYGNQLTGYPSTLLSLPLLTERKLFPNPMSDVPYDIVTPASIGTLTNATWIPFLNTPVTLRKRQTLSTSALISTQELVRLCPLNNVQGADVAAGCVAGIYNRFCFKPTDPTLLAQCHDAYNRAFGASFFKPLGDVCPAWRKGPFSASCANAIRSFSYNLLMGKDPTTGQLVYLNLNSYHAGELVRNIFAQPKFAPCQAPAICSWQATSA